MRDVPVVHAVTDDRILTRPEFLDRARRVMRALGPRGAVHLRSRVLPANRLLELAVELRRAQDATGCWLVVNDRLDVALAAGARGAQLTSRSMRVPDARLVAPGLALGASVHALTAGIAAARDGADWLVVGHVFATDSHPGTDGRGKTFFATIARAIPLPLIAIGGVKPPTVSGLIASGAHGVAAISGIWGADDAEHAAIEYLSSYDAHGI